jgi:hypothetical protein
MGFGEGGVPMGEGGVLKGPGGGELGGTSGGLDGGSACGDGSVPTGVELEGVPFAGVSDAAPTPSELASVCSPQPVITAPRASAQTAVNTRRFTRAFGVIQMGAERSGSG